MLADCMTLVCVTLIGHSIILELTDFHSSIKLFLNRVNNCTYSIPIWCDHKRCVSPIIQFANMLRFAYPIQLLLSTQCEGGCRRYEKIFWLVQWLVTVEGGPVMSVAITFTRQEPISAYWGWVSSIRHVLENSLATNPTLFLRYDKGFIHIKCDSPDDFKFPHTISIDHLSFHSLWLISRILNPLQSTVS